jgi:peptide/nickel transport system permease protein
MTSWIARRIVAALAILWAACTLTFFAVHLAPGDPFLPGAERPVDPAVAARLRAQFGLDLPLGEQYLRYLGQVATGNLGISFSQRRPVSQAVAATLPNTLLLGLAALLIDFGLGISLGALQAVRAGKRGDTIMTQLILLLGSMPTFWLGLALLLVFGEWLGWLPLGGAYDPVIYGSLGFWGQIGERFRHLILPALTLGLVGAAATSRYQRAAMLDVLAEPFIRTARAKGLAETDVMSRHALRNALLPTITLLGLALPFVLTGAVVVETVFGWPGLGRLAADAVGARDYPLVVATTLIAAALVVIGSVMADGLALLLDPRLRRS